MNDLLALKYRPRTFQDMTGQRVVSVVLYQMVRRGQVPTGLLFSGPRGTGKTSAARILAAGLNCTGLPVAAVAAGLDENTPCGYCDSCESVFAGTSLDVIEIDAASRGSVSDIRDLIEILRYSPSDHRRVVLIDECHSMSREAFNALLKTLEEPPSGTTFVLVTTEPEKVPDTVLSRLMEFEFRKVSTADIFQRVTTVADAEEINAGVELLETIAARAQGSVRDALMSLDQIRRAGISSAPDFLALVGEHDTSAELLLYVSTGDASQIFPQLDAELQITGDPHRIVSQMTRVLRDLLVLRSGGTVEASGRALEARIELNQKLEPERVLGALKVLWDFKTKIRATDDPRGSLDIVLVLLSEVFTKGKNLPPAKTPAPTPPAQPRKLTLQEMMRRK